MKDFGALVLILVGSVTGIALVAAIIGLPYWLAYRAVWALEAIAKALQ